MIVELERRASPGAVDGLQWMQIEKDVVRTGR